MAYNSIWIKLYHRIFGDKSFFNNGVKFGKKAFIDPHADILNGKYITLGEKSHINDHSWLMCVDKQFKPSVTIGDRTIIGRNFTLWCSKKITIGCDCMFASYVFVSDTNHGTDLSKGPYINQENVIKEVTIGNNVWLGQNVIVLPGVHIGDNCVIGAGSIVTKDIPSNSIACGNPAKVIKTYDFGTNTWVKYGQEGTKH